MQSDYAKQGKTAAIVAYITIIGTIIAFFMNQDHKNMFASFHIRQAFGLWITFYVLGVFVSLFTDTWLISAPFYLFIIVLILFGLITASREEQKTVPILGPFFQNWFSFIK